MKYFIDTHDKTKGSFPAQELTEEEFFANFDSLDEDGHAIRCLRPRRARKSEGRQGVLLHVRAGRGINSQGTRSDQFSLQLDHRGETRDRCRYAPSAGGGSAAAEGAITHAAMKGWEWPVRRFRRHPRRC